MADAFEPDFAPDFARDLAACRDLLRGGSRSFFAAALLLPRRVHRPATALYAFCRVADDLIDEGGGPAALSLLRARLDAIYAGRPADLPADRALAAVVMRHRIPRLLFDELLEGFAWDAEGRRYEDLAALQDYAAKVAGTVGVMMAIIMGARDPAALARAADLGIAMQLTNIARDVGEDARAGRLYLPLQWLREEGIDPAALLANPAPSPELACVIARLLGKAELLYARADAGIAALPIDCRVGIGAARRLYAAIGHQVIRNRYDAVTVRARVGGGRKLRLVARSAFAATRPASRCADPALAAARPLVASVIATPAPIRQRWQIGFARRVLWLATLFAELDQRQSES